MKTGARRVTRLLTKHFLRNSEVKYFCEFCFHLCFYWCMRRLDFLVPYPLICGDLGARISDFARHGGWSSVNVTVQDVGASSIPSGHK